MFELKKVFSSQKYQNLAKNKLQEQFGIEWEPFVNDIFKVVGYPEASKPYVLILNRFVQERFVRKEWYEFYSDQWNFVGYLTREQCLQLYWESKGEDSFNRYGKNVMNDDKQAEKACRCFLDEHLTLYRSFKLNK